MPPARWLGSSSVADLFESRHFGLEIDDPSFDFNLSHISDDLRIVQDREIGGTVVVIPRKIDLIFVIGDVEWQWATTLPAAHDPDGYGDH
jgi:hypothetical protein